MRTKNYLVIGGMSASLLFAATAIANDSQIIENEKHQHFSADEICEDPVTAVVDIMNCIEDKNASCAGRGYNQNFKKIHNEVDTNSAVPSYFFWFGTFLFVSFELDIDHAVKVADNQVSLRYVEKVSFRDGDVFYQHEHALVTVDGQCKMTLWDQYGDNAEQKAVEDKAGEINPF